MLAHRLITALPVLLGVWVTSFALVWFTPGDATNLFLNPGTSRSALENLQQQRGLDRPAYEQFLDWTLRTIQGDLGYSWTRHRPVIDVLKEAVPATIQLTGLALAGNVFFGAVWGSFAGIWANRWHGRLLNMASVFFYAVPTFWLASIAIMYFSLHLAWLPPSGMNSVGTGQLESIDAFWDRLQHLILPVTVLAITGAAATARFFRGKVRDILNEAFVRTARMKGLSQPRILIRHVLSNALLPVVTMAGLSFPFLLSGAFVVEVIFAWPGMGRIAYEAFLSRDYPVILAVNLLVAIMTIIGNLLADILNGILDPRVRTDQENALS